MAAMCAALNPCFLSDWDSVYCSSTYSAHCAIQGKASNAEDLAYLNDDIAEQEQLHFSGRSQPSIAKILSKGLDLTSFLQPPSSVRTSIARAV
jgi:hypothetical protein